MHKFAVQFFHDCSKINTVSVAIILSQMHDIFKAYITILNYFYICKIFRQKKNEIYL